MKVKSIAIVLLGFGLVVATVASHTGVEYMDSNEFCGTQCHEMKSRYESLGNEETLAGKHYQVFEESAEIDQDKACSLCHYKPGALNYVKTKIRALIEELYPHFFENVDPGKITGRTPNQACLRCHNQQQLSKSHAIPIHGEDCNACHITGHDSFLAFHHENSEVLTKEQLKRVKDKNCSDCHGQNSVIIHKSVEEDCTTCHGQGSTEIHREVRENCAICHSDAASLKGEN